MNSLKLWEDPKRSANTCICRYSPEAARILKEDESSLYKRAVSGTGRKNRKNVPDVSLTTDIIVGFPGETEEDFEETMDIVRKVRYDSVFTFHLFKTYWNTCRRDGRPGTGRCGQKPF